MTWATKFLNGGRESTSRPRDRQPSDRLRFVHALIDIFLPRVDLTVIRPDQKLVAVKSLPI
jgi:hypothetical protein